MQSSQQLAEEPDLSVIGSAWIASPLVYDKEEYEEEDLRAVKMVPFIGPSEEVFEAKAPAIKVLLDELANTWPEASSYSEAFHRLRGQQVASEGEDIALRDQLFALYCRNLLDIYPAAIPVHSGIPDEPLVSTVVRCGYQDGWVTTLRGELYQLDSLDKILLPLMNGTRSRDELLDAALTAFQEGELRMEVEGEVARPGAVGAEEALKEGVQEKFVKYREQALYRVR